MKSFHILKNFHFVTFKNPCPFFHSSPPTNATITNPTNSKNPAVIHKTSTSSLSIFPPNSLFYKSRSIIKSIKNMPVSHILLSVFMCIIKGSYKTHMRFILSFRFFDCCPFYLSYFSNLHSQDLQLHKYYVHVYSLSQHN